MKLDDRLVNLIVRMHDNTPAPFDVFVAEALRSIGLPVPEPEPEGELAEQAGEAVTHYFDSLADPFDDVLGPVYSEVSSHGRKQQSGQFFTPWAVSKLVAIQTLADWEPKPNPKGGLWSLHEPAVGAGAMLLAALQFLVERHGPDALRLWYINAWDIDLTLTRTCALQILVTLARYNWALGEIVIIHGDIIRMEVRGITLHAAAKPREDKPAMPSTNGVEVARVGPAGPSQLTLFDDASLAGGGA